MDAALSIDLRLSFFLSENTGVSILFCRGLSNRCGEFPQQFLLLRSKILGDNDPNRNVLIATSGTPQILDPLSFQTEHRSGLGSLRDIQLHLAVNGRNLNLSAESRLCIADLMFQQDIRAFPFKAGIGSDNDINQQIAGWSAIGACIALSTQRNGLTVINAGGNRNIDLMLLADLAHTMAGVARILDNLAGPVALLARCGRLDHTQRGSLCRTNCASSFAVRAGLRLSAGFGAGTAAVGTGLHTGNGNILFAAKCGFFEADGDVRTDAFSFARPVTSARSAASEDISKSKPSEDVSEDITQIAESAGTIWSGIGIERCMTVLIIQLFLFGIRQDLVGLIDLLKTFFAGFVTRMQVWMVLFCQFSICFFQFVLRCFFRNTQDFIIVSFIRRHSRHPTSGFLLSKNGSACILTLSLSIINFMLLFCRQTLGRQGRPNESDELFVVIHRGVICIVIVCAAFSAAGSTLSGIESGITGCAAGLLVPLLRYFVECLGQFFGCALDGSGICSLQCSFQSFLLALDLCSLSIIQLIAHFFQSLLGLVEDLIALVAGIDFFFSLGIFGGKLLCFANCLLNVFLGHVGRRSDGDVLLFSGSKILGGYIDDTVGIDIKCYFDLRNAAACRSDSVQVELSERLVVSGHLTFALQNIDFHGSLVVSCSGDVSTPSESGVTSRRSRP